MPAEQSIAKLIVNAFVSRVAKIDGGAEYHTALGSNIIKGRPNETVEDLPCVFVFSTEESSKSEKYPRLENTLYVIIEGNSLWGQIDDPTEAEDVAQDMITDIKKAVLDEKDITFKTEGGGTNLARRLGYLGRVIGYSDDGTRVVAARVSFEIEYFERAGSPHIQA